MIPTFHLIYLRSGAALLSRNPYADWREIQDEWHDYMTSLGPWTADEVVEFFRATDTKPKRGRAGDGSTPLPVWDAFIPGLYAVPPPSSSGCGGAPASATSPASVRKVRRTPTMKRKRPAAPSSIFPFDIPADFPWL